MDTASIRIDSEFQQLLWPLSSIEFSHLEQSIIKDGCRDSLVVWAGHDVLVDGHNRFEICRHNGIDFSVVEMEFADRDAVCDWIDKNQASRRNCTPDQYRIITGRIYNRRKKPTGGRTDRDFSGDQFDNPKTAELVAEELGVSAPTIIRNGQRAEVFDAMLETGDEEAAEAAKTAPQKIIQEAKKNPEQAAEILKKPHVANNSGEQDWYTPIEILESARNVIGEFDLDPASSDVAQQFVSAKTYFTKDDDGLNQDWRGTVWLNPPYSSGTVDKFSEKLIDSMSSGSVGSAIVLVNNATDTRWFHLLASRASAICFTRGRISFLDSSGQPKNKPLQGQSIIYFGKSAKRFVKEFKVYGFCVEGITCDC